MGKWSEISAIRYFTNRLFAGVILEANKKCRLPPSWVKCAIRSSRNHFSSNVCSFVPGACSRTFCPSESPKVRTNASEYASSARTRFVCKRAQASNKSARGFARHPIAKNRKWFTNASAFASCSGEPGKEARTVLGTAIIVVSFSVSQASRHRRSRSCHTYKLCLESQA